MQSHPDALVLITGDFNYRSTGFNAKYIQRSIGLFQIIKVHTRDNVTLDWCLTNRNDSLYDPIKLPPLGNSDHNMVCLKSLKAPLKPDKVKVWKRDLRESSLQPFGRWITSFDWSDIFTTNACEDKYGKFNDIMSDMIDILLPLKKTKVTKCDKSWLTSSIKELILKRQKAPITMGKIPMPIKSSNQLNQPDLSIMPNQLRN
jgi:hypothetical protein